MAVPYRAPIVLDPSDTAARAPAFLQPTLTPVFVRLLSRARRTETGTGTEGRSAATRSAAGAPAGEPAASVAALEAGLPGHAPSPPLLRVANTPPVFRHRPLPCSRASPLMQPAHAPNPLACSPALFPLTNTNRTLPPPFFPPWLSPGAVLLFRLWLTYLRRSTVTGNRHFTHVVLPPSLKKTVRPQGPGARRGQGARQGRREAARQRQRQGGGGEGEEARQPGGGPGAGAQQEQEQEQDPQAEPVAQGRKEEQAVAQGVTS